MVRVDIGGVDNALIDLNDMPLYNLSNDFLYDSIYARLFNELDIKCSYFSESNLCDELNNIQCNFISCFSLNIQSIRSKFLEFNAFLSNLSTKNCFLDLICLSETWCADYSRLSLPGYSVYFSARSSGSHGGSAIYVKDQIISSQLFNENMFIDNLLEATTIKIELNGFKAIVMSIYRPNTSLVLGQGEQIDLFLTKLNLLLEFLDSFNLPVLIQGDFNINLFNLNDLSSHASTLLDMLTPFGYIQTINRATRIQGPSATLLDHCYIKDLMPRLISSGVVSIDLSDHYGTFTTIKIDKIKKTYTPTPKKRLINETTKRSFFNALSSLSWVEVTTLDDPSLAYSKFLEIFLLHYNLNFPWVINHSNKKYIPQQPFMTPGLLRCRAVKEDLSRATKTSPLPNAALTYKKYRNIYTKAVRTSQKLYVRNQIAAANGDSRKIWSTIKDQIRVSKKSNKISKIIVHGETLTNNIKIANAFNTYFSSIGPSLSNSMPESPNHFSDFLPPPNAHSFFMTPISEQTFHAYILSTKPKLGTDDNDISMRMLHDMATPLTKPLCYIFNLSIEKGIFPSGMKTSRCIPIHKSGSIFSLDNFRGVVMINSFSKVFEKIFGDRLITFLDDSNFFINKQFGFRKGYSTTHALCSIINEITKRLNEDKMVLALLLDIKKCFDAVDRTILFAKLYNAGIRGHILEWVKSYFSNRNQRVYVNGFNSSNLCDILFGVLQGSILGVIFFLIFINDIPNASGILMQYLFADDNTCLLSSPTLHDLLSLANIELDKLLQWYNANQLTIHPQKTKAFLFTSPRGNIDLNIDETGRTFLPLFLNMNSPGSSDITKIIPINLIPNPEETSTKLLGIQIDNKLNFKNHFKHLHGRLTKAIFSLRMMKHILDKRHLTLLYNSYLKSALEYGCILFTNVAKCTMKPIITLQKKAIRLVCSAGYRDHTAPLFKKERILPFADLIFYNICRFMFAYSNNSLPADFNNTWQKNADIHQYRVRNANDFFIVNIDKQYLHNHPLFYFPKAWNSLPENLKSIGSQRSFARDLYSFLIDRIET